MSHDTRVCKYSKGYQDTETREYKEYHCDRASIPHSTYCKFHDSSYYETDPDSVRELFLNILKKSTLDPIFFIGCNIPDVKISEITQLSSIYFVNTKFHGNVKFVDTVFRSVNFTGCKTHGKFTFLRVKIDSILLFDNVSNIDSNPIKTIFKRCNFKEGRFFETKFKCVEFIECDFFSANFRYAQFHTMKIEDCRFTEKTDFAGATIEQSGKFISTVFHSTVKFHTAKFLGIIIFDDVDFKEQKLVRFGGNLANMSFLRTDITRIRFDENTVWGKEDDHYLIYDARELIKTPSKVELLSVLATYRGLRENYEFRLMYEEAGQFFVREMDLRRKYCADQNDGYATKPQKIRRYFSIINCYNLLCQYGENLNRVMLWALIVFAASTTYFYFHPEVIELDKARSLMDVSHTEEINNVLLRLHASVERTLSSFFQVDKNHIADYIVRASSLTVLGTLFVVLRRKLERRFRH